MFRLIITLVIAATACLGASCHPTGFDTRTDRAACDRWVDSVFATLSQREKVAQIVFPKALPVRGADSKAAIRRYVEKNGVGGLLLTAGSLDQYVETANYVQSIAKVPVLMTFDGEWGLAMRIEGTPKFPSNMALGAVSDPALLYEYGREMARECRLAGIHVNFAPVLDVNSNPRNPVIGYRSFGEDPHRVATHGTAYARGLEDGGVQAVGKHFPGHGDTATDSHKETTRVDHSPATLREVDLVPFQSFVDNGISGVMVGHIVVPALDPSGRPATLSHKITTELLRDKMGFEGLVYTDALGMKGASFGGLNSAIEALNAGADVLLGSNSPIDDIDAIVKAISTGKVSAKTVDDRCRRVLRYKYMLGLSERPATIDGNGLAAGIKSPEAQAVMDALAQGCITVLRNSDGLLPLGVSGKEKVAVLNLGDVRDNVFADVCRRYTNVEVYGAPDGSIDAATMAALRKADIVVAAVFSDDNACRNSFGRLSSLKNLTGVFLMNPYKMNKFAAALAPCKAIVLAYDNLPSTAAASAMALFGGIEVTGKLPVDLPKVAPLGTGIRIPKSRLGYSSPLAEGFSAALTDSLDRIVAAALADGAFPGAQLLVARHGNVVYERAFGNITDGGDSVSRQTLYDLASVSKATGTLPGIMKAYDLGLFDLDMPAATYIPGLEKAGKSFTPREMLFHETGMPAAINVYPLMMDTATYSGKLFTPKKDAQHGIYLMKNSWGNNSAKIRRDITSDKCSADFPVRAADGLWVGQAAVDTIMNVIYNQPIADNKAYRYSCLNFCLLLDLEQRVTGIPHDTWVADSIFGPIGALRTGYRAGDHFPLSEIAPTENDTFMRRQVVHGYVHDETAAMQGGVSGNAGLFSCAGDLAKLCQMWLNGGSYGGRQILSPETVRLFTTAKSPTCHRGLGFDKPNMEHPNWSSTCEEAGPEVFGHLGFTGTVFWVDPANDIIFIFLNNRVNPTRDNSAFSRSGIRPELFRQVLNAIRH